MNRLIWGEPFGGWGTEERKTKFSTDKEYDTGLCNRILHWEIAHDLNKKNDFKFDIIVENDQWPELELIDLPHTIGVDDFNFDCEHTISLDELRRKYVDDDYTLNGTTICSNFGFSEIGNLLRFKKYGRVIYEKPLIEPKNRPLQQIKLKHRSVYDQITEMCKGVVGIHIRRGNGVDISDKDIDVMSPKLVSLLGDSLKIRRDQNPTYYYVGDEFYFEIIDEILTINPQQKIYVSCDMPDKYLFGFHERYGNNIINKRESVLKIESSLKHLWVDVEKLNNMGNVVGVVVDLFTLSQCEFQLLYWPSSWSKFARFYKNRPHAFDIDGKKKIIKKYTNTIKKSRHVQQ